MLFCSSRKKWWGYSLYNDTVKVYRYYGEDTQKDMEFIKSHNSVKRVTSPFIAIDKTRAIEKVKEICNIDGKGIASVYR